MKLSLVKLIKTSSMVFLFYAFILVLKYKNEKFKASIAREDEQLNEAYEENDSEREPTPQNYNFDNKFVHLHPVNDNIFSELNEAELKKKILWENLDKFYKNQESNLTLDQLVDLEKNKLIIDTKNIDVKINNIHFLQNITDSSADEFVVLLVQVHNRLDYLTRLVDSLRLVDKIDKTLVVFSHDYIDDQFSSLMNSINFVAFAQIYFPYSMQIYPDEFPGTDLSDCPRDLIDTAINCSNKAYPDIYKHYREAKFVQIKHHWMWKISFVFEKMAFLNTRKNLNVLLLEEDNYLMPDALYTLHQLRNNINLDYKILSLAVYIDDKSQPLKPDELDKVVISSWKSNFHSTGLLFTRNFWEKFKLCKSKFCRYDDYNWDWSFNYAINNCLKSTFSSVHTLTSRIIHMGACGVHSVSKDCDAKKKLTEVERFYFDNRNLFFPKEFKPIFTNHNQAENTIVPNGGWSDPRDFFLCESY